MKAKLTEREPEVYQKWVEQNAYDRMATNRLGGTTFTIHDGPPYANGPIHIGTAMNKILKDFVIKHRFMNGYRVYWKPGWDCHGLPIERGAVEALQQAKKDLTNASLAPFMVRNMARLRVRSFVRMQMEQFQSLGVVADWQRPYLTLSPSFEAEIYNKLCLLAKSGLLYERLKPVLWSWKERTALATTEVEYKDHECNSVYVAMNFGEKYFNSTKIVIWTTTPWTLPANAAVAVHPDEEYVLTENKFIVAQKRHEALVKLGVVDEKTVNKFKGQQLAEGLVENPLRQDSKIKSQMILSDQVDMTTGTGCVHIAPGHGELDYELGVKNKLPTIMPVDEKGCYTEEIGEIVGHPLNPGDFVFKAEQTILNLLEKEGALLKAEKLVHSYPFCERSNTPVIFRATKQWFIKTEALRSRAVELLEAVKYTPENGRENLKLMVGTRPDWCVSRQRDWGVPIAFFRHKKTGRYVLNQEVLAKIEDAFRKNTSDAWLTKDASEFLPENYRYSPDELEQVHDVLDVWFDSGATWHVLGFHTKNGQMPADLYLEGRDQYRGWFSSSALLAVAATDRLPFREIVCHGFVTDETGRKMAKSVGNVIAPQEVLKSHGAEILRLWVATSDYTKDLKIGKAMLDSVSREYAKLRNTMRFLLANLNDFEPQKDTKLKPIDSWICDEARQVFEEVNDCFFKYQFAKGMHKLTEFVYHELSGLYMSAIKDRMYCGSPDARQSGQQAMVYILRSLVGLLAPILTYTCDEVLFYAGSWIWKGLRCGDIFDFRYSPIPKTESKENFPAEIAKKVIENLHGLTDKLKQDGKIKDPLELMIGGPKLEISNDDMAEWLVVSRYDQRYEPLPEVLDRFFVDDKEFVVFRSNMDKCPRCWKRNADSGQLCTRCKEVV